MRRVNIVEVLSQVAFMFGYYLITQKMAYGFLFEIVGLLLFIYLMWKSKLYFTGLVQLGYVALAVIGFFNFLGG